MKKSNIALILIIILQAAVVKSQEAITLSGCYKAALQEHPIASEKQIQYDLWQIKDKNLLSSWYPSLDASANVLYNTNIVNLSDALEALPFPGMPDDIGGMPHDQYKLNLDVNQVIWDGGAIKNSRLLEEASLVVNEQDIEIALYKVRENVNSSFFGLVLLKRQKELLHSYLGLIELKLEAAESAIQNGLLLPADKNSIIAEKLKLEQQVQETGIKINAFSTILADLTGLDINQASSIVLPEVSIDRTQILNRPELLGYEYRLDQLEASKSLIKSSRMPKAFGFATLGYGSPPGNDFFSDEFGTYAVLGAGIRWKIFDWNNSNRNRQMIDLNKNIVSNRKQDLEENLQRALINKYSEIEGYSSLLESDDMLIDLRKSITLSSESQFRNGTITSTEYMSIINLEKEAILSHNIHQVSFIKSQVEYLNISGNEIK